MLTSFSVRNGAFTIFIVRSLYVYMLFLYTIDIYNETDLRASESTAVHMHRHTHTHIIHSETLSSSQNDIHWFPFIHLGNATTITMKCQNRFQWVGHFYHTHSHNLLLLDTSININTSIIYAFSLELQMKLKRYTVDRR